MLEASRRRCSAMASMYRCTPWGSGLRRTPWRSSTICMTHRGHMRSLQWRHLAMTVVLLCWPRHWTVGWARFPALASLWITSGRLLTPEVCVWAFCVWVGPNSRLYDRRQRRRRRRPIRRANGPRSFSNRPDFCHNRSNSRPNFCPNLSNSRSNSRSNAANRER